MRNQLRILSSLRKKILTTPKELSERMCSRNHAHASPQKSSWYLKTITTFGHIWQPIESFHYISMVEPTVVLTIIQTFVHCFKITVWILTATPWDRSCARGGNWDTRRWRHRVSVPQEWQHQDSNPDMLSPDSLEHFTFILKFSETANQCSKRKSYKWYLRAGLGVWNVTSVGASSLTVKILFFWKPLGTHSAQVATWRGQGPLSKLMRSFKIAGALIKAWDRSVLKNNRPLYSEIPSFPGPDWWSVELTRPSPGM